jgi:hypothetical protein
MEQNFVKISNIWFRKMKFREISSRETPLPITPLSHLFCFYTRKISQHICVGKYCTVVEDNVRAAGRAHPPPRARRRPPPCCHSPAPPPPSMCPGKKPTRNIDFFYAFFLARNIQRFFRYTFSPP